MNLKDLVVLDSISHPLLIPEVIPLEEANKRYPELEVDVDNSVWSYRKMETVPIGNAGELLMINYMISPTGVYDKTKTDHLTNMVRDAVKLIDLLMRKKS